MQVPLAKEHLAQQLLEFCRKTGRDHPSFTTEDLRPLAKLMRLELEDKGSFTYEFIGFGAQTMAHNQ